LPAKCPPGHEQLSSARRSDSRSEFERKGRNIARTAYATPLLGETATYRGVGSGWNPIRSGLKTLLETGKPLEIAPAA
jgi:hypothetical protein